MMLDRRRCAALSYGPAGPAGVCPTCHPGARALGGLAGAARVQTDVASTEGHELKQPAHDRDVFQEVEELILIGDVAVKNERRRDREDRQNAAEHPYLPT